MMSALLRCVHAPFPASCDPHALPSFPTRRSSDLLTSFFASPFRFVRTSLLRGTATARQKGSEIGRAHVCDLVCRLLLEKKKVDHSVSDLYEVLDELGGHVFVDRILPRQLQVDGLR